MTLSPVFRSEEAVAVLRSHGIWDQLESTARGESAAITTVIRDLPNVLDAAFLDTDALATRVSATTLELKFVQDFFFLILFRSVLSTIGVRPPDLNFCSEINFCIKGTITAADNLFDDQDKALLPLRAAKAPRFLSILQLLAFERLASRVLGRAQHVGCIASESIPVFQRELLSRMAAIGTLEGSEETGVREVLAPERMIEQVHRIRGGALFELAFVAPSLLATPLPASLLAQAQRAISRLGTAFQIVDDLTDFEFDYARGRHNLVVSQIVHHGTAAERRALTSLGRTSWDGDDLVAALFFDAAKAVIERGEREAHASLEELRALGFWLSPDLSTALVRAIVGLDGVARMRLLTVESGVAAKGEPERPAG
jgi:hypothetical protein